jgi:hypothetical protein
MWLKCARSLRSSKMNDLCLVLLGNYYKTSSNKSSFYPASPSYLNSYIVFPSPNICREWERERERERERTAPAPNIILPHKPTHTHTHTSLHTHTHTTADTPNMGLPHKPTANSQKSVNTILKLIHEQIYTHNMCGCVCVCVCVCVCIQKK